MNGKGSALAWTPLMILLAACGGGGASPTPPASGGLDAVAEAYVKLVLAVGRHDEHYVDAFYGPPEWRTAAEDGPPVPLAELLSRARSLLDTARRAAGPAERRRYLEKQLVAVEGHLRRLSGERMTLAEECRVLFDADPPRHDVSEFAAAHDELERLAPGDGPLGARVEVLRKAIFIPRDRLAAALEAALGAARAANALPPEERFETALVTGKPWGAYNWYLGNYKSRIELNTDLPVEANGLLGTMVHEGYPGHHVFNVLLERNLVKGKGWVEYTVYPLYSPQSLLAEGTANVGIDILYDDEARRRVLAETIAPAAGVPAEAIAAFDRLRPALKKLKHVRGEAARMLLDEGRPEDEVAAFVQRWELVSEERARKAIQFARTYRSYVFNYSLGEEIVAAWIGEGEDRRQRFFDIISGPVVPSDLK
jgi:hypothetical protein